MDFSIAGLFSGLVISSLGAAMLIYGKKQQAFGPAMVGLLLCIIPFFPLDLWIQWVIAGLAIGGLVWRSNRA